METINLPLQFDLLALIEEKVASGMYPSSDDVICEGLRLLSAQEEVHRDRLEALKREVELGTQQLEGKQYSVYASGAELAEKIKQRATNSPPAGYSQKAGLGGGS